MNDERPSTAPVRRACVCVTTSAMLVLLVACGRTPDPAVAPPIVLLPSSASASSVSSVDATSLPPGDAIASGPVGTLTLPPDAAASSPSAPMTAGVPRPDPSASLPTATSIGSASRAADAQPPSVSPGTRQ